MFEDENKSTPQFITAELHYGIDRVSHTYNVSSTPVAAYFPYHYGQKNHNAQPMPIDHRITMRSGPYTVDIQTIENDEIQDTQVTVRFDSSDETHEHTESLSDVIPIDPKYMFPALRVIMHRVAIQQFNRALYGNERHVRTFFIDPQYEKLTPPRVQEMPDVTSVLNRYMEDADCSYVEHSVHTLNPRDNRSYFVIGLFQKRSIMLEETKSYYDAMTEMVDTITVGFVVDMHRKYVHDDDIIFAIRKKATMEVVENIKKHVPKTAMFTPEDSLATIAMNLENYFAHVSEFPEIDYLFEQYDLSDHADQVKEHYHQVVDVLEGILRSFAGTTRLR